MKYLIKLSYDGTNYYGWNKQPNFPSINQEIEEVFNKILDEKIKIKVCGRTDKGVHALEQICTIELNKKINKNDIKKINKNMNNIKIKKCKKVNENYSLIKNVKNKTYLYKINTKPSKKYFLKSNKIYNLNKKINLKIIKENKNKLIGYKNFKSFTSKTNYHNYYRTINKIKIKKSKSVIYIEINGNGFMRYMVRNIVGAFLYLSMDKISIKEFDDLLKNPSKGKSPFKAPSQGLYLKKVNLIK